MGGKSRTLKLHKFGWQGCREVCLLYNAKMYYNVIRRYAMQEVNVTELRNNMHVYLGMVKAGEARTAT